MPEGSNGNRFIFDAGASAGASVGASAAASEGKNVMADTDSDTPVNLAELLDCLGIDSGQPLLTLLNGSVIQVDAYTTTQLADDDKLALMPPITAG